MAVSTLSLVASPPCSASRASDQPGSGGQHSDKSGAELDQPSVPWVQRRGLIQSDSEGRGEWDDDGESAAGCGHAVQRNGPEPLQNAHPGPARDKRGRPGWRGNHGHRKHTLSQ